MQGFDSIGANNDKMEYYIVGYQVISHVLAYFYLYGSYISQFDLDLIIVCALLLSRKVISKYWI